jgi:hypothetical protein
MLLVPARRQRVIRSFRRQILLLPFRWKLRIVRWSVPEHTWYSRGMWLLLDLEAENGGVEEDKIVEEKEAKEDEKE